MMSQMLIAWLMLSFMLSVFINAGILLYVSLTKLESVEQYLVSSKLVQGNQAVWGDGLIGRLYRQGNIAGVFILPRFFEKHEVLVMDELANVPRSLKLWITLPHILAATQLAAALVIMCVT